MAHYVQQHGKPVSDLWQVVNSNPNVLHCLVIITVITVIALLLVAIDYDDDDDNNNNNNNNNKFMLIDVAISEDRNVINKEAQKILKYKDLIIKIQRMWNVQHKWYQ